MNVDADEGFESDEEDCVCAGGEMRATRHFPMQVGDNVVFDQDAELPALHCYGSHKFADG